MSNIPYYIVAVSMMFASMMVGIALDSGADHIREQAEVIARTKVLNSMTLQDLGRIDVREI